MKSSKVLAVVMVFVMLMPYVSVAADPLPGTDPNSIFKMWKPPSLQDHLWKGRFSYVQKAYENIQKFYKTKFDALSEKNRRCLWAKILFSQASLYYDITKGKNGSPVGNAAERERFEFFRQKLRDSCDGGNDDGFRLYEEYKENIGEDIAKVDLVRRVQENVKVAPASGWDIEGIQQRAEQGDKEAIIQLYMMFMAGGVAVGCATGGPLGCALP